LLTVNEGTALFTKTVICAEVMQFEGLVATNEYTVVTEGETTREDVEAPVLHE
jgi:hypothetical protein